MSSLITLPDSFTATRDALQRVAVHIVARAVIQADGRIDLRVAPGGFATPEFGDGVQVRVTGSHVVREVANAEYESWQSSSVIDGSSLTQLAAVAEVDLDADLYVGGDTPPLGDRDEALRVDQDAADALAGWYHAVAIALDRTVAMLPAEAAPTAVRFWPEHFDVALDAAATTDIRANLGGSPGDGFHAAPYAYVGPWTDDRPGDESFWNAPFGAVLSYDEVAAADDAVATLTDFFVDGMRRLAG